MSYLRYSDIALRVNLNPFNWNWVPRFAHDAPTSFSPNRNTFVVTWLFLQVFFDFDNGVVDIEAYTKELMSYGQTIDNMDAFDEDQEDEMARAVPRSRKRNSLVE